MDDLRLEIKSKLQQLYDGAKDKYCNGCYDLEIQPPYRGITTCDVNPWRDMYKCKCKQYDIMWLESKKNEILRCIECMITGGKAQ